MAGEPGSSNDNTNKTSGEDLANHRTIEICNLSLGLNPSHLREVFGIVGEIEDLIIKFIFGKGRVCIIRYARPEMVQAAEMLNGQEFDGNRLKITPINDSVWEYHAQVYVYFVTIKKKNDDLKKN
ncbi:hypothetical protein RFI_09829 [Reticulomyxa filosa]|uniref:RRM domain-containing protein n=1 Tax=Reticulomyxa filosa TaxID=46433 RepID=X6NPK1_RETFI|nr:hypothetical protein RFI_09829 [Reticulomyxa filosa]|eukprot:ETO27302.1 hypothetical protein RFI_09829 [Reticulomyxa filosa]